MARVAEQTNPSLDPRRDRYVVEQLPQLDVFSCFEKTMIYRRKVGESVLEILDGGSIGAPSFLYFLGKGIVMNCDRIDKSRVAARVND